MFCKIHFARPVKKKRLFIGKMKGDVLMKKKLPILLCAVLALFILFGFTEITQAEETAWNYKKPFQKRVGAFTYHAYKSKDGKKAWIYKIDIKKKKAKSLSIPSKLKGKKVTRIGYYDKKYKERDYTKNIFGAYVERFHNYYRSAVTNTTIKKVIIPKSVTVMEATTFCGLTALKSVVIPPKVEELKKETFYGCINLKTVTLPEKLKYLDPAAFQGCPSLKKMRLSPKNQTYTVRDHCVIANENQALVYALPGNENFQIPEGIKIIKQYAFNNCISRTVNIPASVTEIEGKAFERPLLGQNEYIKDVTVSAENQVYARDGRCIYNTAKKSLSVVIAGKDKTILISPQVENLDNTHSIVNFRGMIYSLEKTVFPKTLKSATDPALTDLGDAKKVYFLGEKPPEILNCIPERSPLPIFCRELHVPENSLEVYKNFYKQHDCDVPSEQWFTFRSEEELDL